MALINRTLIIFKYLWEISDESHTVSLADISAYLKQYDIAADPRTLHKDIEQLVEFGVDIVKDRKVQNLYHVASRHFEAPEVKLLIDAVQSARFITPKKSKDLVKRLSAFVAPHDTKLLNRQLYIDDLLLELIFIFVDQKCVTDDKGSKRKENIQRKRIIGENRVRKPPEIISERIRSSFGQTFPANKTTNLKHQQKMQHTYRYGTPAL